jgi:hypothetical protein
MRFIIIIIITLIIIVVIVVVVKRKLTGARMGYKNRLAISSTNGFRFPLGKNIVCHHVHPALGPKQRPIQSVPELLSRICDG